MEKIKNAFVSIEGNEGVGKTTVVKYVEKVLTFNSCHYICTREPGGTEIAEKIRALLLDHHQETMAEDTELLLLFAGRAQHLQNKILPALERGDWVLTDRFTDASFAYQGGGRGLSIERIELLANWVQGTLWPDLTILLDAPVEIAMQRVANRGEKDRIEQESINFFESVRKTYLDMAKKNPNRYVIVDASQNQQKVCYDIGQILKQRFGLNELPETN